MNRTVAHRGPDGEGAVFIRSDGTASPSCYIGERTPMTPSALPEWNGDLCISHDIAMGHRRFAIIDLTEGGHQPFLSQDGSLALSFNGEIYNYLELRKELQREGHVFLTNSDAEVLLHSYRQWGVNCFERLQGFWALVLWDRAHRGILFSRDRIGKAPLYYARYGGKLWWCSEIKGLLAAIGKEAFPPRVEAIRQFVRAGLRDVGDETFYEGIRTFPKASHAWVAQNGSFEPQTYWSLPSHRISASEIGKEEAVSGLEQRLKSAVKLRLRSDVPIGVELSGGLDSSSLAALAALARDRNAAPMEAFTVGFPGTNWDETPFARMVANHYPGSLRLQELIPDESMVLRGLDAFSENMDEPFHSPNMVLNQEIWRRMAALGIRVSLNGAGGDEVFAGYGHEYMGPYLRQLISQGKIGRAFNELAKYSERESNAVKPLLRTLWLLVPDQMKHKLRDPVPASQWDPLRLDRVVMPGASESIDPRMIEYLTDFKMNYWLRSGNTSCMAVPMEVRLPLLDPSVVEWGCRLPMEYLIRDGWLKWVLRKAVEPSLPEEVVWRKTKMGFPFPLSEWLHQSKPHFASLSTGEEISFMDRKKFFEAYDFLAKKHPAYLWRCLSVMLWWDGLPKRVF